jgi:hypothetical protein
MKSCSQKCEKGPCPKSCTSPAIVTHSTSASVMHSSGCAALKWLAKREARCATPRLCEKRSCTAQGKTHEHVPSCFK